jgi:hypothetical protein
LEKRKLGLNSPFKDKSIHRNDFYQRMFYRHKVCYIDTPLAYHRDYNHQNRLSAQTEKYIGIEKKMYQNFKKWE